MKNWTGIASTMLNRLFIVAASIAGLVMPAAPIPAATIIAQLFPKTGEIRLLNRNSAPVPIVFYSIKSNANTLTSSSSVWDSITDTYDAPIGSTPGNGFVDPGFEWMKISASSSELAEGVFLGPGGSLLPWRPVSLGRVWNPINLPSLDLTFEAREPNGQTIFVSPELALDGDYFADRVVNQIDYNLWRQYFGSTSILFADGNLNGVVDAADYVVWRKNVGMAIPAASFGAGEGASLPELSLVASVVPEPGTTLLSLLMLSGLSVAMHRRRPRC